MMAGATTRFPARSLVTRPRPFFPGARSPGTPVVLTDTGPKLSDDAGPPAMATIRARETKWTLAAETVEFPVSDASEKSKPPV